MKRYLAFGYCLYYPGGGSDDVIGGFDSFDEAKEIKDIYDYLENEFLDVLDMQDRRWLDDDEMMEGLGIKK